MILTQRHKDAKKVNIFAIVSLRLRVRISDSLWRASS
jgi:hypothetical protein